MSRTLVSAAFAITAFVLISSIGCAKKNLPEPESKAVITFISGKVTLARGSEKRDVVLKDTIIKGDTITTEKKSIAVLQIENDKILRIESDSSLAFDSLNRTDITLVLDRGTALSKINKLGKGQNYSVKTPTALAAVRGTQFLTSYNGTTSVIAVGDGKVEVTVTGTGNLPKTLEQGKTALVSNAIEERDISNTEKTELDKLSKTMLIDGIESKSVQELEEIGKKYLEDESSKKKNLTLDEIRAKYGRIDVVTLYTGQVIRGAIISRSSAVTLITPEGEMSIAPSKIKQTESK